MINVLIPAFLILCFYNVKFSDKKFNLDNLSRENTNSMKGLFAVSIIFCHLSELPYVESFYFFRGTGSLAVSMFFFLSGYGLMCSYEKNGLNNFFKKRISTVLIPFLFVQLFSFILFYYLPGVQGLTEETYCIKNLLLKFIKTGRTLTVNAWYVYEILLMYLEFWLAFKIGSKNKKAGTILIVVFTLLTTVFFGVFTYKTEWLQVWAYTLPAFAYGIICQGSRRKKIESRLQKNYYAKLLIFIILTVLLFYSYKLFDKIDILQAHNINSTFLSRYLTSPFFVTTVLLVSMKFKAKNVLLDKLGNISYELYLYHGFVYCLLRSGTFAYVENDTLFAVLVLLVTIDISIAMNYISKKITHILFYKKQSEVRI